MKTICDFIAQVNRGCLTNSTYTNVVYNHINYKICDLLLKNGFIYSYGLRFISRKGSKYLVLRIKYKFVQDRKVFFSIRRISHPGHHIYWSVDRIRRRFQQYSGFGIVSTSCGILTTKDAVTLGVGGEVLLVVD